MSMRDSVSKLVETSKQLKIIADNLDDVEIKSQLLGVVFQMQEVHEAILADWEDSLQEAEKEDNAAHQVENQDRSFLIADSEKAKARIERSDETETYSIAITKPEAIEATEIVDIDADDESVSEADKKDDSPVEAKTAGDAAEVSADLDSSQAAESDAKPGSPADTESTSEMTPEQSARMAEARLKELEPLHQAAVKKLNDVLTEKQQQIKAATTKAGRKAGKKGQELQRHVLTALQLTDKQREQMTLARKELHGIRVAIDKEIDLLLSDKQKARMKTQLGIR